MTNFELCAQIYSILKNLNVDTVVICAGARNAPLIHHLEAQGFNTIFFFEERSAAFYALGLTKQSGKPVAVMATSGTAAAELLPATIEAYYQGLPLILITADRPKNYRGTGAPQAIEQVGLFKNYVEQDFDWDVTEKDFSFNTFLQSPIHFNVCFDEPLIDLSDSNYRATQIHVKSKNELPIATRSDFKNIKKPVLVIGQIKASDKEDVIQFIKKIQAPVYLEALSQLLNEPSLAEFVIKGSDGIVKTAFRDFHFESVIRIGGIPTLRFWRDLETEYKKIPVYNFTELRFSGLSRPTENFKIDFSNFETGQEIDKKIDEYPSLLFKKDQALQAIKSELLLQFPNSEPAYINKLSRQVENDPIYIGNSLPIREWDLFSIKENNFSQGEIYANRGANGIDGQISTYLGWSRIFKKSWCLVGDLTALYDLAALGLESQNDSGNRKNVVVMNNYGGQIFNRVFKNNRLLNSHRIEFQKWAEMWNWNYIKVKSEKDFKFLDSKDVELQLALRTVIELQPDEEQTRMFWTAWDSACQKI